MGRLFYLLRGRREVAAAALPLRGALPAVDLMKVQGHAVQMEDIHQSNNMSDDESRKESSTGRQNMHTRSAISLGGKNLVVKNTFVSLHQFILLYVPVYVSLTINRYQLDFKTLNKMILMMMMTA